MRTVSNTVSRTISFDDFAARLEPGVELSIQNALAMPSGFAWITPRTTIYGWGKAFAVECGEGPKRFASAAVELDGFWDHIDHVDETKSSPRRGPIAFGSFTFDEHEEGSMLVVPAVSVRIDDEGASVTITGDLDKIALRGTASNHSKHPTRVTIEPGSTTDERWLDSVRLAKLAIERGELQKVVLARRFIARSERPFDRFQVIDSLSKRFPECFVFCFDGLVGASPELLVRVDDGSVVSRPLAGSTARGGDAKEDESRAQALIASSKERSEHAFALATVIDTLKPLSESLDVPAVPSLLRLANVQHLQSEVTAKLNGFLSSLDLAGALHPTAAVCGVPRDVAFETLKRVEGFPRGRYAGPIGWTDRDGNGEWAVALRCAELDGSSAALYAGAGIVAESDPQKELEEVALKLDAMIEALQA